MVNAASSIISDRAALLGELKITMAAQKSCPSFASIISVLSIALYGGGFLRVELELNKQRERIDALETDTQIEPLSNDPDIGKISENSPGKLNLIVKQQF